MTRKAYRVRERKDGVFPHPTAASKRKSINMSRIAVILHSTPNTSNRTLSRPSHRFDTKHRIRSCVFVVSTLDWSYVCLVSIMSWRIGEEIREETMNWSCSDDEQNTQDDSYPGQ
ncbi:hypothetical protein PC129_g17487 [Phytophthora cactorum]|uniref:Uncharacterized protein n=1 Tax=Phytophthora cactorum TaxID=29920 RepID=A0A8T1HHG0_9STRA|nr:hypothetical protein PC129_g17487 [Phytophthora cactorum]